MSFGDFAIAPSTTVTLCKSVPLAKGSEDTLYFASAAAQASTISSFGFATFSEYTYQRNSARNVIRIGLPMGSSGSNSALRANYCIFNNSAFEGKNIYCFVDSVDYVNNNTIDVTFTIDAVQTFMFDYQLRSCYVEREHSMVDEFGANLIPEDFGEMGAIINSVSEDFLFTTPSLNHKYACVIYFIQNKGVKYDQAEDTWVEDYREYELNGRYANNVYVAAEARIMSAATAASGIDVEIENIIKAGGTVVNVQMIPQSVIDATDLNNGVIKNGFVTLNTSFTEGGVTFTPKNKKMFSYPYNYLLVTNNAGMEKQYRWEYFTPNGMGNRTAVFEMYGGYQPSPEVALVPSNYKNVMKNYGEMITYNNFPSCSWSEDSFLQWKLRNGNSYNASMNSTVIQGGVSVGSGALVGAAVGSKAGAAAGPLGLIGGAVLGAAVGAGMSAVSTELNYQKLQAGLKDQVATPDRLAGSASNSVVNEVVGNTGFTIYRMHIPLYLAQAVDEFFTMYGYATRRVKVPDISSRPAFNYVKTQGCLIAGDVPAPYAAEIQERFNNGIRFWKSADHVGDYSVNNSPS